MVERAFHDQLVAAGIPADQVDATVAQVFAAIRETVTAGRRVVIPDVGVLDAPRKNAWVPGAVGRLVREQRKVRLRYPAIVAQSEPWQPEPHTITE